MAQFLNYLVPMLPVLRNVVDEMPTPILREMESLSWVQENHVDYAILDNGGCATSWAMSPGGVHIVTAKSPHRLSGKMKRLRRSWRPSERPYTISGIVRIEYGDAFLVV